ncbi:MAG: FAD:protein FMN transferase [Deltaproteobacteria bacterium]|nr:MAG: FAD:protein FMN transferase [Deltaproteobacteria bacterium]
MTTRSFDVMATRLVVVLPADRVELADRVAEIFAEVEATANEWRDGTPLSQVNAAAGGEAVAVPADLRALLARGLELGERTDGAFDVTWAALWGLWDFEADPPVLPDPEEIARRVARVDYRQVELDEAAGTVRLARPGMKIGLGGIAKGWALDKAVAALREAGLTDFHVVIGGQVYAAGHKGDRPWHVGIRDPRGARDDVFAALAVTDRSVSTSGDYERYFVLDGTRYHHILDPRTGWPARGLRSATVIAPDATTADGLSTALMVLGKQRALALVESMPGVEAVLVDEHGAVSQTSGVELVMLHPPRP